MGNRAICQSMLVVALVHLAGVANASELVPYEAMGWRYQQVPWGSPLIDTFYSASFDDSGWPVGQAAFGNFGEVNNPPPFCTAVYSIHSQWDVGSDVLLRRYFTASTDWPVTIYLSVDNDTKVYINGALVFETSHDGCPLEDDFSFVVPGSVLAASGTNLLAVWAHDRGGFSFVDLRIEGELLPVSSHRSTWGSIKALYR